MIEYIVLGVILLLVAGLLWGLLKKVVSTAATLILNSIAGVLILLFLNIYLGWDIPLNIPSLLVCGLFGMPGVGALIILHLFRMI
jgi:pro-sigmaK processing inhibitor BofA